MYFSKSKEKMRPSEKSITGVVSRYLDVSGRS